MDSIKALRFLMFYIAVASLATLISCSDEEQEEGPILEVSPTTLDLGEGLEPVCFNIANAGVNTLHWYIEDIPDWLSIEPTMGETVSEIEVKASVIYREGTTGSYETKLWIKSNGGNRVLKFLAEITRPPVWFSVAGTRISIHGLGLCTYDFDTYDATGFRVVYTCTLGADDYRNPTGEDYNETHSKFQQYS